MKNLLSIEQLSRAEMDEIFQVAAVQKQSRGKQTDSPLRGQTWGMIFSKPSTRTRVSFEVGVRELGGETIFLNPNDIQLGRGELIKDTARVLARMVHGAIIRSADNQCAHRP
jgi:ornithine carbamoyltransferase